MRLAKTSRKVDFGTSSLKSRGLMDYHSDNEGRALLDQDACPYNTTAEAFFPPWQALACSLVSARFDVRLSAYWQHVLEQAYSQVSPLSRVQSLSAWAPWVPVSPYFHETQQPAWPPPVVRSRVQTLPAWKLSVRTSVRTSLPSGLHFRVAQ
jgi:hypothetical protein